ncbi:hypothetical protein ERO13_D09G046300v2 [Gossypium hirsutum]|uniref:Uncharacterized protein n=2 Tax=Gossypium TaxID=3633 RepID=A0A5J5PZF1_GOSBA|nr:hypothetical protein ES319_D09G051900v1 [Gossypium barbadense]KAG4128889.1 hypothetical protein ERO13_D09G046300v2 [Gossypium hirsutum]TYG52842.1 hypothetical protein ES288_D09G060800v1 [Gossypium darwinii]
MLTLLVLLFSNIDSMPYCCIGIRLLKEEVQALKARPAHRKIYCFIGGTAANIVFVCMDRRVLENSYCGI